MLSFFIVMTAATKLNPKKILSQLANSKGSGCLKINEGLVCWQIYLHQGNLQYVNCSAQMLDQLKYHLHYLGLKQAIAALKNLPPSFLKIQSSIQNKSPAQNIYGKVISWLLTEKHLNLSQGIELIESITKDELQFCLWLDKGTSSWQEVDSLPLWIPSAIEDSLSFNVSKYLKEAEVKSKQWQSCSQELVSVHQRPYFPPSWETKPLPASGSLNRKTLVELTQLLKGRISIRQLSILLKKDELQVAKILSPYIDEKIIYLHHAPAPLNQLPPIPRSHPDTAQSSSSNSNKASNPSGENSSSSSVKPWKIVCIDDSPTILSEIQRFLSQEKFEITAIDDPVQAVSKIFSINPDLILLDITMPRINGYKLCGLLRSSGKCDDLPIIMVTGNTGLVDKARAKLAGATDYFTKPFTQESLNQIISKYLI